MKIPSRLSMFLLALFLSSFSLSTQAQTQNAKTLFPVEKESKWGFIDRTGKIVIPLQYDSANNFREGVALVTVKGKKLFIDASGRAVITPQFDIVDDFSEGVAAVNIGQTRIPNLGLISNPGKWGYIDKTGQLVLPLKYTHAEDFSEGLAAVKDGDHSGFIDHQGNFVFDAPLDVTLGFHEGMVGVLLNGTITYFDRTGKRLATPVDYGPKSYSFSEGLVPVSIKGKWGFMDQTGRLVITPQFEDAEDFSEGLAPVKVKGETVWCPADASGNRSGSTMMYGYIDKSGKLVIPATFNSAAPFSEGRAAVRKCDDAFFIGKQNGLPVISGRFTYASSFSGGLASFQTVTREGTLSGYVNLSGMIVWWSEK